MNKQLIDNFVSDQDMFKRMHLYTGLDAFEDMRKTLDNTDAVLQDAFSLGQLESKRWLVDTLKKTDSIYALGTVFLCAGWYGTLASMLFDCGIDIRCIRSFDIDPSCGTIAETVNRQHVLNEWKFKATTDDISNVEFDNYKYTTLRKDGTGVELCESADTIINTSCEHIENFAEWYAKIPKGRLVILQSNNYFELPEHINCVTDEDQFATQAPMQKVVFKGSMLLPKYKRFMIIGYR